METQIDAYGRTITKTVVGEMEVYSTDGIIVAGPIGYGWTKALDVINAHAPVTEVIE